MAEALKQQHPRDKALFLIIDGNLAQLIATDFNPNRTLEVKFPDTEKAFTSYIGIACVLANAGQLDTKKLSEQDQALIKLLIDKGGYPGATFSNTHGKAQSVRSMLELADNLDLCRLLDHELKKWHEGNVPSEKELIAEAQRHQS